MLKRAEELYKECVEARAVVLGDSHPDTLISRNGLALLYLRQVLAVSCLYCGVVWCIVLWCGVYGFPCYHIRHKRNSETECNHSSARVDCKKPCSCSSSAWKRGWRRWVQVDRGCLFALRAIVCMCVHVRPTGLLHDLYRTLRSLSFVDRPTSSNQFTHYPSATPSRRLSPHTDHADTLFTRASLGR
jgi:hypothetical protein